MNQGVDSNQTFSFGRWIGLVTLHWASNKRRYLLALPAIAALLVAWDSFLLIMNSYSPLDDGIQAFTYYWGLALVGCLYASTIFSEFDNKAQGIAWLAVPASPLEKLLCRFLFSTILCFIGYTLVFYVIEIPMVEINNRLIERQHRVWPGGYPIGPSEIWSVFKGLPGEALDQVFHAVLVLYFVLQALFALGSVYFERYAFVKTVIGVILFIFVLLALEKQLMAHIPPRGWTRYSPANDWIINNGTLRVKEVRLSLWFTTPLGLLLLLGVPPAIWIAVYFRIKEKQV